MSQNCWAHKILIKVKREDKKRAKRRVKRLVARQAVRQSKSLDRVAVASAASSSEISTSEPADKK
jgi:hypothetical protein